MANGNEELFTIRHAHPSYPPVYKLVGDIKEMLEGTFYESELQKVWVREDKLYRIESVLLRQKMGKHTEGFVKWYGSSF